MIGSWRTRTPVAWKTALATAAETQTAPSSGDVLGQERGVAVADLDGFRWHAEHLGGDQREHPGLPGARVALGLVAQRQRTGSIPSRCASSSIADSTANISLAGPGSMEGKGGTDVHRHSAHWKSLTWSMAH